MQEKRETVQRKIHSFGITINTYIGYNFFLSAQNSVICQRPTKASEGSKAGIST
jgi:hypothetical protein